MAGRGSARARVAVAVTAALVLLSCAGPGQFGRMASELVAERKYQAALEMYDKALQTDSTEQLLMGRAACAMHLKRFDIAMRDYSVVIARKGKATAAALLGRGQAFEQINNADNAVRDYGAALGIAAGGIDIAHAYYLRARAYRMLGRHDPALADCQRSLDRDPTRAHVYELRGDIFADMGNARAASENYTRALDRYRTGRRDADAARVDGKMRGKGTPPPRSPRAATAAPNVVYRVEAADPRMRAVGEYLLMKPLDQIADIMLKIVLGEVPDWKQDAWRAAAQHVDFRQLQDRYADIMGTQLSRMELESLVRMLRLERSSAPSDVAELEAMKYSEYGAQVLAREQVAFTELLKAYREQLRGACLALGLGC